jgi:hypothetical protein
METNLKYYDKIPNTLVLTQLIPQTHNNFSNGQIFFKNWLVGFTNAVGSFFIKSNGDCCFQLKHETPTGLVESILNVLDIHNNIYLEKSLTNNYNVIRITCDEDIQKIINFFSFKGLHPLVGLKYIQYLKWLKLLKDSNRYKNLIFPNI